jgi:hypothetical protein
MTNSNNLAQGVASALLMLLVFFGGTIEIFVFEDGGNFFVGIAKKIIEKCPKLFHS